MDYLVNVLFLKKASRAWDYLEQKLTDLSKAEPYFRYSQKEKEKTTDGRITEEQTAAEETKDGKVGDS